MKETRHTVVIFFYFQVVSHGTFTTFSLCSPIYLQYEKNSTSPTPNISYITKIIFISHAYGYIDGNVGMSVHYFGED